MLSKSAISAIVALALTVCSRAIAQISAAVDPRVEFISAVARTAGFGEYRMTVATSPYSAKVDALFKNHHDHPAVLRCKLMRKGGFSYDAVISLALHVTAPPEMAERIDFAKHPARLDSRLNLENTRALLADLRDLAAKVKWDEFFAANKPLYDQAAARLAEIANKKPLIPWFDKELGVRQGASYQMIPGLLNGGQCYGTGVQFQDGTPEELRPVIGCWTWDSAGVPTFSDPIVPIVAHELCHSYTNPVIDRHEAELKELGDKLYAATAKSMDRMAYRTGKIVLYETLVRAMVVHYMQQVHGDAAARRQNTEEIQHGFTWVPNVAAALSIYSADRAKYPTIDDFIPTMAAILQAELAKMKTGAPGEPAGGAGGAGEARDQPTADPLAPKLVKSSPADGATAVPTSTVLWRIEFDRPMRTDSYSVTGTPDDVPKDMKLDRTEDDGRIWYFKMTLEPGRTYTIGLNGGNRRGFKGAGGAVLAPTVIRFTTATAASP